MKIEKLLNELDIFVDFGEGDKFLVKPSDIDLENNRLILKGCQGQMRWVRIDENMKRKYGRNR